MSVADILRQLGRLAMKEGDHEKAHTYLHESLNLGIKSRYARDILECS